MNRKTLFLLVAWCLTAIRTSAASSDASKLIINEIQVSNLDMFIDPSYNYGGWVEFYNPTDESISLSSLYMSNDPENLRLFRLLSGIGTLPAHGYRTLWFDHYDKGTKYSTQAAKQIDFHLGYEGGTIYLTDATQSFVLSQTYPPAIPRCSYARTTDGGDEWRWCSTPTPAASNNGSEFADVQLAAPEVDTDSKVFTQGFTVKVKIPTGAKLYYTTDGSTPSADNGSVSTTGSFTISGASRVYRFRLYQDGYLPSSVVTRSYLYKDRDYYLPIVSVVTDDRNLYDDQIGAWTVGTNGITGNGISYASNKNRSWERPVNFEYLMPDESDGGSFLMAMNQECDFEVSGGWSRNMYAPNASFRLKGNKYYLGQNFLACPFFKEKPYIKTKAITVRNGGNDGYARLKDAAIHRIILRSGFYVDCQECQPAHVFVNGQFLFTYNIREVNNKNHGYSNYGIDTDEMDQFEINGSVGYEQKTGDDVAFKQWMNLTSRLGAKATDDSYYEQICELVDIDEYCNYMATECYVGCGDWATNSNNIKGYRSRNGGKFHLVFMDLDGGFSSSDMINQLAGRLYDSRYSTGKNFIIDIFLNMLKYEPFRKRFIDAFCLVNGSVFEAERSQAIVTDMVEEKVKAMEFEGTVSTLRSSGSGLINAINNNRTARMNAFRNYFGLSSPINVELSSNIPDATLLANGQEIPTGKFKGQFYAPMVLTAQAPAGYRFAGWTQDADGGVVDSETVIGTEDAWYYYDQGSLDGQNWKAVSSYSVKDWSRGDAPFGYGNVGMSGSADYQTTLDYGEDSQNKRPTYYFRKTFQLSSAPKSSDRYVLKGYVDDGCVVYVNGQEIGRYLMPEGEIHYEDFSTTYAGATAGECSFVIDNNLLKSGVNVIAVEIHNTHEHSSDIYWTAELSHQMMGEAGILHASPTFDLEELQTTNIYKLVAVFEPLTEEERKEDLAVPLRINEVSAGNSVFINDYFKKNDWLELYNPTDLDLNVAGLYISDKLDNPMKYQIPSSPTINTIVPAHGYLVIWADKLDPVTQLHVPFKLENGDSEAVCIVSSPEFVANNEAFFNAHPTFAEFADGLLYVTHGGDQSVGRYPDGSNDFYFFHLPSIGKQNSKLTVDNYLMTDYGVADTRTTTLTYDLMAGWNWISHPFLKAQSVNCFNPNVDCMRSRSLDAFYSPDLGKMFGTLTSLEPNVMYKAGLAEAHSCELSGMTATRPVDFQMQKGWNWIGYPFMGMQTLTDAFDGLADEGDMIIGQAGFSVYDTADGWVGTLSTLMPGTGYLYYSAKDRKVTMKPSKMNLRLRRRVGEKAQGSAYGLDPYAFLDVMGVIAQLQIDDKPVDAENLTVLAYAQGKCRGVGEYVDGRVFMTLYGGAGEVLTLKVIDEQGLELKVQETVTLTSSVEGTRTNPVIWHMEDPEVVDVQQPMMATTKAMPTGYYNLFGSYVGKDASKLRAGIYVVRRADGTTRKVSLRR